MSKSFIQIAEERGCHVVDAFLDLAAEHGEHLRWYSVMAEQALDPRESTR